MSMKNEISFWPSRFASLRDTVPVPTTWGDLVEEIRGGRHLTVTRLYRETCARLAEAEAAGDIASVEELKRRKVSLKTSQAAFVCSVILEGGRSQQHVRGYSDKAMVDIDDLNGKSLDTLVARVKADPHTFLAYVTLSGRGLRVVARVEPAPTDARTFARAWQTVNDYYARLLGVKVDAQCKNATRMSVLCHDPEVCYRPEAEALVVEPEAPARPRASRGRPVRAVSAAPTVRRLVEDDGILYAPGSHNAYICRCLYWMNRFGVSEADAEAWALSEFADYDAAEHSVAATVRSCYAQTAEHATCRLARYARARTSKDKSGGGGSRAPRVSVEQMEDFIGRWCQLRRNLLIHQLEVRLMDGAGEEEPRWQLMTDALENSLWRAMQHEGLDADLFRLRTLLQSDFVPTYHPLRRYLDTLPPWDGTTDYIGRLARMVVCRGTSAAEFDYYFRRWLVGMLAAALDDGVVNHEILVLLGPQGSFKSSFLENLLPPCLRRYYTTKTNSQRLTKDDLFTMTENLLVNFEEIDSMQRPELNQLKAMTTTLYINERPAYGRNKVRLPHVASFCATGNNLQFLTDDTGNRRWLPFEVEHIENPWTTPIDYEGVYAQAKALLDGGFRYWFQGDEVEALNRRNRRFEAPNPARELILAHYRRPSALEKGRYLTASQICARFASMRLSPVQVGRAMKELGFEQVETHHGRFWLAVERSVDEMNSVLPESSVVKQDLIDESAGATT